MNILAAGMPIPVNAQTTAPPHAYGFMVAATIIAVICLIANIAVTGSKSMTYRQFATNCIVIAVNVIAIGLCFLTGSTFDKNPKIDYSAIENHYGISLMQSTQKTCGDNGNAPCNLVDSYEAIMNDSYRNDNPNKDHTVNVSFVDGNGYMQSGQLIFDNSNHVALWTQKSGNPNLTEYKSGKPIEKYTVSIFVDHKKQQLTWATVALAVFLISEIVFIIDNAKRSDKDDKRTVYLCATVTMLIIALTSMGMMIHASSREIDGYDELESHYGISNLINSQPSSLTTQKNTNNLTPVDFHNRNGEPTKGIVESSDYKLTLWVNQNGRFVEYKG